MKKLFGLLLLSMIVMISFSSCTENIRAKNWGGKANVDVKPGYKVINVTWKNSDLWILVEPAPVDYAPKTYIFYEKSKWGLLNGTFYIYELSVPTKTAQTDPPTPAYNIR